MNVLKKKPWRIYKLLSDIYGPQFSYKYYQRLSKLLKEHPIQTKPQEATDNDVILIAYGDHVRAPGEAPLKTLGTFTQKHLKGAINTIHILPHYPYTSDDGFAVSDYLSVNPELGTWEDIHSLAAHFRLMFDGVFNHVSASHPWFQAFLADEPRYREYFISLDKTTDVSLVTRPRTSPLLVRFDTAVGEKYVWATFSADQLDLNYANVDLLLEVIAIILEYIKHGASLIRLDAVGFIWKELGTSSIHRPRAHAIIQLIREIIEYMAPWVWIVTETNVPHNENVSYFGNGRNEAHMVYNFALPPLVVHTMQTGDASVLTNWAEKLVYPFPSSAATFFNFTASHDGIGIRGATKILSDEQILHMCERVKERGGLLSMRTAANGKESVYEMNISYYNAVTDPDAPLETAVNQFICSQAIALSLRGIPGIYLHSLVGSENWPEGVKKTGQNRSINREKLNLKTLEEELAKAGGRRNLVFNRYLQLLRVRSKDPAFSRTARQIVHTRHGSSVFAVERVAKGRRSRVLALHNVSNSTVAIKLRGTWRDLLTKKVYKKTMPLGPYQVAWLKSVKGERLSPIKQRVSKKIKKALPINN